MSPGDVSNWVSIYLATAICCAFSIMLTSGSLVVELMQERFWTQPWSRARIILFVPRIWWRWQRRYLLSTPVTLGIVGSFSASLSW